MLPRKLAAGAERGSLEPGHAYLLPWAWRAVSLPQGIGGQSRLTGLPRQEQRDGGDPGWNRRRLLRYVVISKRGAEECRSRSPCSCGRR